MQLPIFRRNISREENDFATRLQKTAFNFPPESDFIFSAEKGTSVFSPEMFSSSAGMLFHRECNGPDRKTMRVTMQLFQHVVFINELTGERSVRLMQAINAPDLAVCFLDYNAPKNAQTRALITFLSEILRTPTHQMFSHYSTQVMQPSAFANVNMATC